MKTILNVLGVGILASSSILQLGCGGMGEDNHRGGQHPQSTTTQSQSEALEAEVNRHAAWLKTLSPGSPELAAELDTYSVAAVRVLDAMHAHEDGSMEMGHGEGMEGGEPSSMMGMMKECTNMVEEHHARASGAISVQDLALEADVHQEQMHQMAEMMMKRSEMEGNCEDMMGDDMMGSGGGMEEGHSDGMMGGM